MPTITEAKCLTLEQAEHIMTLVDLAVASGVSRSPQDPDPVNLDQLFTSWAGYIGRTGDRPRVRSILVERNCLNEWVYKLLEDHFSKLIPPLLTSWVIRKLNTV